MLFLIIKFFAFSIINKILLHWQIIKYELTYIYLQRRFNSNLLEIGAAFLLPTVIIAFASPKLGKISDIIGSKKTLVASLSILIIILLILPFTNNVYLYELVWKVYCIAITLLDVTLNGVYVTGSIINFIQKNLL